MKKKIIGVLVSLLMVIPFVFIAPKADVLAQGTVATNYGSYHWECFAGTSQSPISFALNFIGVNLEFRTGSGVALKYNFKNKYSGQITIGITTTSSWRYDLAYCSVNGGAFNSTPANMSSYKTYHSFTINFEQATEIDFTVYLDGIANANIFDNSTVISISYGITPYVDDKLTEIDKLLDDYIPGMSTSLSNIYNSLGYNSTDTLANDIDTLNNLLGTLNNNTDQLESLIGDLTDILDSLLVVSMYDIEAYQHSAWYWCSKKDSEFPRWQYGLPYGAIYTSTNDNTYTANSGIRLSAGYSYIMVFYTNNALTVNDINVLYSSTTGNVSISSYRINEIISGFYLQAFEFTNTNNGFTSFEPEFLKNFRLFPLYFGLTNNIPDDIRALLGIEYDNTYTRLLQQISNGVNGVYDTSEYDQYEETIDNLNDNLLTDVNNSSSSILTDISNQSGTGSGLRLNNVRTAVNGFYNDLITIFPSIKYIVIFGLVILVLGVVL